MKVLVLPLHYDHQQQGMIEGFQRVFGAEHVAVFDYLELGRQGMSADAINESFVGLALAQRFDWIFMQLQETGVITAEAVRQLTRARLCSWITHWTGDYRPVITPYLASICQATDVTFASSKGQLADFFKAGAREVVYAQIGLDWGEDVLGEPPWTPPFRVPDVVFLGNYYESGPWMKGTEERLTAARALRDAGFDFGVVGSGWPSEIPLVGTCGVKQQHHVWKRAKVAINVNHANDVQNYYSDRMLIAMASGTPVVTRYVPGLEDEFENGTDLYWFKSEPELLSHVRWLLGSPENRVLLGATGRYKVMREHSWTTRVLDMYAHLRGIV